MDITSSFRERLSELIFDNKLTWDGFGEAIGVSRTTAYRWKLQPMQIKLNNLLKITDYFNCSIEYLIGRSNDDKTVLPPQEYPKFSIRLREVMKEKGVTTYSLRKTTRFDGKYFEVWDSGSAPVLAILIEFAELLDVTIDYLVGRDR